MSAGLYAAYCFDIRELLSLLVHDDSTASEEWLGIAKTLEVRGDLLFALFDRALLSVSNTLEVRAFCYAPFGLALQFVSNLPVADTNFGERKGIQGTGRGPVASGAQLAVTAGLWVIV